MASEEVMEALADPRDPAQELTPSGVIEALMDPDDPLGLGHKESFELDVDLDADLDHIITSMGRP